MGSKMLFILIFSFQFLIYSCVSDTAKPNPVGTTATNNSAQRAAAQNSAIKQEPKAVAPANNPKTTKKVTESEENPETRIRVEKTPEQLAIERAKVKSLAESKIRDEKVKNTVSVLPSACALIEENAVGKILGIDPRAIGVKDGSGPEAVHSKACFFRWDHEGIANSGVLIQIQDNPVADEHPEWAKYYISSKINQGDKNGDGTGQFRYKDWGVGVASAYNYEMARYYWRTENDLVFMIAFNLPSAEAQQLVWAEKLYKEVTNNYNSK